MWTYIIDEPKAKLKLTVYEAMAPIEWDGMIAALNALRMANVLVPELDQDEPQGLSPEALVELTNRQGRVFGIDMPDPGAVDVEDPTEPSSYEVLNNLFNAVLKELGIRPDQDPVIKAREIAAELKAATTEDDSESFSATGLVKGINDRLTEYVAEGFFTGPFKSPIVDYPSPHASRLTEEYDRKRPFDKLRELNIARERFESDKRNNPDDPWYRGAPGERVIGFHGPVHYDNIQLIGGEEAKVTFGLNYLTVHPEEEHVWHRGTFDGDLEDGVHRCGHGGCRAVLQIRNRPLRNEGA